MARSKFCDPVKVNGVWYDRAKTNMITLQPLVIPWRASDYNKAPKFIRDKFGDPGEADEEAIQKIMDALAEEFGYDPEAIQRAVMKYFKLVV